MHSTQVDVVIVSFNSGPLLTDCVRSVLASDVTLRVILSDNGSSDGSVDATAKALAGDPRLRIQLHGANLGFAAAANAGLGLTVAPWILFLNPDCVLGEDTLRRMLAVVTQRPEVGLAGCLLRNPDGSEQRGCRRREPTPQRSLSRVLHFNHVVPHGVRLQGVDMIDEPVPRKPVAVDAISGAFMLARREAIDRVGPLDEGYFLHCEDLDWCRRFRDAGYTVLFVPQVRVVHHKGISSRGRQVRVEWHKHRGMLRYYAKFFSPVYPRPLSWLVHGLVWTRFGLLATMLALRGGRR